MTFKGFDITRVLFLLMFFFVLLNLGLTTLLVYNQQMSFGLREQPAMVVKEVVIEDNESTEAAEVVPTESPVASISADVEE